MPNTIKNKKDNKMVIVSVYFWTQDIPDIIDGKVPYWTNGSVSIRSNKKKGIKTARDIMFKDIDDIPRAIKETLDRANLIGIKRPTPIRKNRKELMRISGN